MFLFVYINRVAQHMTVKWASYGVVPWKRAPREGQTYCGTTTEEGPKESLASTMTYNWTHTRRVRKTDQHSTIEHDKKLEHRTDTTGQTTCYPFLGSTFSAALIDSASLTDEVILSAGTAPHCTSPLDPTQITAQAQPPPPSPFRLKPAIVITTTTTMCSALSRAPFFVLLGARFLINNFAQADGVAQWNGSHRHKFG